MNFYTENSNSTEKDSTGKDRTVQTQDVYMLFCTGEGPIGGIDDIEINDQPNAYYKGSADDARSGPRRPATAGLVRRDNYSGKFIASSDRSAGELRYRQRDR